jgi:hypothetical protein
VAKLSDIDIVRLAVGHRPRTETKIKINPMELARLSEDKSIPERAQKIVLREVVRLTRGEDIDDEMRRLIGWWASQRLNGGKRGRRNNKTKEEAIYLAFKMITRRTEGLNPKPQRKAIISFLAQEFGVKQRRIYEAIKRQQPRKSPPLEDEEWSALLKRVPPGAEREKLEAMYKQWDRVRQLYQQRR